MIKNIMIAFSLLLLISCESAGDIKYEIEQLKAKRNNLQAVAQRLDNDIELKNKQIESINIDLKELNIIKSGKTPLYILKLELKQSRFSLDISEHIKDNMNAISFEMPVSKEFYKECNVGTKIVDKFRSGSFVLNGSFSDWNMKVIGKEMREL